MTEAKMVIAKNITELRLAKGMTQIDLATELHYSDKAVSKWERGESVPEINTLVAIARLFDVSLDWLVTGEEHQVAVSEAEPKIPSEPATEKEATPSNKKQPTNRVLITALSVLLVCLVATLVYVVLEVATNMHGHWLSFVYSAPASLVVWLVFNSVWFDRKRNYLIISLLTWSFLASLHLTFLVFDINIWQLYFVGVPAQLIIIVWSKLQFKEAK